MRLPPAFAASQRLGMANHMPSRERASCTRLSHENQGVANVASRRREGRFLGMCDRNATVRIPRCARWCAMLRYLAEKQGVTAPARMRGKCIARDTDRAFPQGKRPWLLRAAQIRRPGKRRGSVSLALTSRWVPAFAGTTSYPSTRQFEKINASRSAYSCDLPAPCNWRWGE